MRNSECACCRVELRLFFLFDAVVSKDQRHASGAKEEENAQSNATCGERERRGGFLFFSFLREKKTVLGAKLFFLGDDSDDDDDDEEELIFPAGEEAKDEGLFFIDLFSSSTLSPLLLPPLSLSLSLSLSPSMTA